MGRHAVDAHRRSQRVLAGRLAPGTACAQIIRSASGQSYRPTNGSRSST
jgi:hypothetical protein